MNEPLTNILSIVSLDDNMWYSLQKSVHLLPKWVFSCDTIAVEVGIEGSSKPFGEKFWILSLNCAYLNLWNGVVWWHWRNRPSWGRFEWLLSTPTTNSRRENNSSGRNNTRFLLEMSRIASFLYLFDWGDRLNWWNSLDDITINHFSRHILCSFILLGCHWTFLTNRVRVQQLVSSFSISIVTL